MRVSYSEEAIADIVEAITYLKERSPTAAATLDTQLAECIERLARHEFDGPVSRLRSGALVRSWPVQPFRIYYQRHLDVRRLILRDALRPAVWGVVLGLGVSLWWSGALKSVLFELQPHDPWTFVLVGAGVLVVVALASTLPARRASRVDPVIALRTE